MSDIKSFTLTKPINVDGKEISELVFKKELNAGIVAKVGFPFIINSEDGTQEMKASCVMKYLAYMTEIHPPLLGTMNATDFMKVTGVVMGFFGEGEV